MTALFEHHQLDPVVSHFHGEVHLEVSPGWVPIVRQLNSELSSLDPSYRLSHLHAHDGVLQVLWSPSDGPGMPEAPTVEDPDVLEEYHDRVARYLASVASRRRAEWEDRIRELGAAAVLRAWRESSHTCEECGRASERHRGSRVVCGWCQGLPYE